MQKCKKVGLEINNSKIKIMSIKKVKEVKVDSKVIEYTSDYKYLGQTLSAEKRMNNELKIRTAKAWKAIWEAKNNLKKQNASQK